MVYGVRNYTTIFNLQVRRTINATEQEIAWELRINVPAILTLAIVSVTKRLRTVTDLRELLAMMVRYIIHSNFEVYSAMEPTLAMALEFVQTMPEILVSLEANATINVAKVPKIVSLPPALHVLPILFSAPATLVMVF